MTSDIRYYCYPRTEEPPEIVQGVADAFREHESELSTREMSRDDRLKSDDVLGAVRPDLEALGFTVEGGEEGKITRTVLYGENGGTADPAQVDGVHDGECCVLEVEAGRGMESNAVHRDLLRTMAMEGVDLLALAVPNVYKRKRSERPHFDDARRVVRGLFDSPRVDLPYRVALLGY